MRCEEFEELLPDYLQQTLGKDQLDVVDRHLEQCQDCREQVALWKKLSLLPQEQPSPALRTRFEAMLAAYQQGVRERQAPKASWLRDWRSWLASRWFPALVQPAVAILLLAIGFAVGKYGNAVNTNSQELTAVRQELSGMRQLVVLSLLQQQSASERLQGVTWSMRANRPDPEILSALLHTLRFDTSADVRLAALDALKQYNQQPQVRTGLIDALHSQQSPLVQIALIDLLVELRETNALRELKEFERQQNVEPVVRQRAEWGIVQLTRG
ncbi:MAG TPA: HEAT repeat domain-containing protein [Myxococcaceae bacterium]|nr:HEAT repeat domain-containing protein [Myxococcaceae bacterium]